MPCSHEITVIIKCHQRCLKLSAREPSKIIIPVTQEHIELSFANSNTLQSTLQNFSGQGLYHLPSHKYQQLSKESALSLKTLNSHRSLKGVTVFTDGSEKTRKAIVT